MFQGRNTKTSQHVHLFVPIIFSQQWLWFVLRDTLSEAVVPLRTVVTFVTWFISRTEFSSLELVRSWDGERRLTCCLLNTSTFVPNDRSQCLHCANCAFGAHLDVGFVERPTPCRFIKTVHVSYPRFREDGRLSIRRNRWYFEDAALNTNITCTRFQSSFQNG